MLKYVRWPIKKKEPWINQTKRNKGKNSTQQRGNRLFKWSVITRHAKDCGSRSSLAFDFPRTVPVKAVRKIYGSVVAGSVLARSENKLTKSVLAWFGSFWYAATLKSRGANGDDQLNLININELGFRDDKGPRKFRCTAGINWPFACATSSNSSRRVEFKRSNGIIGKTFEAAISLFAENDQRRVTGTKSLPRDRV